jgi:hypothetical protein
MSTVSPTFVDQPVQETHFKHTEKRSEVNNTQNPETTSKVRRVFGAMMLILGVAAVVAGVLALVLPPIGVTLGLAGAALLAVSVSLIGGGLVLSSVGSFFIGKGIRTQREETITDECTSFVPQEMTTTPVEVSTEK